MRDSDKQRVYDAETLAFIGTPLDDRLAERDIINLYEAVRESALWPGLPFEIVQARADMVNAGGSATGSWRVKTSAGRTYRSTVSHECAHLLHALSRSYSDQDHGFQYRKAHVRSVSLIFGQHYGAMLCKTYNDFGLSADTSQVDINITRPIINIDALSIAAAPTGGWRRPS